MMSSGLPVRPSARAAELLDQFSTIDFAPEPADQVGLAPRHAARGTDSQPEPVNA